MNNTSMRVLILLLVFCSSPIFSQEYLLRNPEFGSTSDEIFYQLGKTYDLYDVRGDVKSIFEAWFSLNLEGSIVDFIVSPINQHFFQEIAELLNTPTVYLKYNIVKYIVFTEKDDTDREWEIKYYFYFDGNVFRFFMVGKESIERRINPDEWIQSTAQLFSNYLQIDSKIYRIPIQYLNGRPGSALICSLQDINNLYFFATILGEWCFYNISKIGWSEYINIFNESNY